MCRNVGACNTVAAEHEAENNKAEKVAQHTAQNAGRSTGWSIGRSVWQRYRILGQRIEAEHGNEACWQSGRIGEWEIKEARSI